MATQKKQHAAKGAVHAHYYEGPADISGDVCLHQRVFAYNTDAGMVAGVDINVMFYNSPAGEGCMAVF